MAKRNIIVVGTSAGGVEALFLFIKSLPKNFNASVFVVLHLSAFSTSNLPRILSRAGSLPTVHPQDGEKIEGEKSTSPRPTITCSYKRRPHGGEQGTKGKPFPPLRRCPFPFGYTCLRFKGHWHCAE